VGEVREGVGRGVRGGWMRPSFVREGSVVLGFGELDVLVVVVGLVGDGLDGVGGSGLGLGLKVDEGVESESESVSLLES
jgi:hypothetical protein